MKSLVKLLMLLVATPLSQNLSIAPGFAQPVKASVGAAAVAIIGGHPSSIAATLPVSATQTAAATITVSVPRVVQLGAQTDDGTKTGKMQITNLDVTLNFNDTTPVTLTFTSPDFPNSPADGSWQVTLSSDMSTNSKCPLIKTAVECHDFPAPSRDNITISPGPNQKEGMQFVVHYALLSNYNVGGSSDSSRCASTQTQNPKYYLIKSDSEVTSASVDSYSKHLVLCTSNQFLIHLTPPDLVASVDCTSCGK